MPSSDITWHEKLGSAFLKARDLRDNDRAAFLRELGATDAEMASWVERMLAAEHKSSPILEGSSRGPLLNIPAPDIAGARVGQYTIKRRIGAGGMGAVYEAVQDRPRRSVAVKILPAGLGSPGAARRFEYESEVLARLRHPAIAQVYEAGIHSDAGVGFPFFAMEFVPDARPITAYAKHQKLDARRIVELFVRVCDAVHHGHQRGVIHRDLKPDNILVDAAGHPKVIDFGVARAVDRDARSVTLQTEAGQLVGTVPYMSPEQVGGEVEDLDTRTDVYSLGVVLFEMLTDRLPHDVAGKPLAEAIRIIRETAPQRAGSINAAVPADLDRILAKALATDREQRYASAADFGADLTRFLNDEPIVARPPSVGYQLRKFAKRNKTLVVAACLVFLTLVGGVVAERLRANEAVDARNAAVKAKNDAIAAKEEADDAKQEAQLEATRARQVIDFLDRMLTKVKPDGADGKVVTVQQVLDEMGQDIDQESDEIPEVEASIRFIIGHTYLAQGLFEPAKAMLEKADEIHKSLGLHTNETVRIINNLAKTYTKLGNYDKAVETFDRALAMARELEGPEGDSVLWILTDRSQVQYFRGQLQDVVDTLKEIIRIRVLRNGLQDREVHSNRANLAMALLQMGRFDEAEALFKQALAYFRVNEGETDADTLDIKSALAGLAFDRGNYDEGIKRYRDLIGDFRKHFGDDHPHLAYMLYEFSSRLDRAKMYQEAEKHLREALAIQEKATGKDSPPTARMLNELSSALSGQGQYDRAIEMQKRAMSIYESASQTDTIPYAWAVHEHANTLLAADRCAEASEAADKAVELLKARFGDESNAAMTGMHLRALIEVKCGDIDRGIELTRQVVETRKRILPAGHPNIAVSTFNLGEAYLDGGRLEEAVATLDEANQTYEAMGDSGRNMSLHCLTDTSLIMQVLGRGAEARRRADAAATIVAQIGDKSDFAPRADAALAGALLMKGDVDEAATLMQTLVEDVDPYKIKHDLTAGVVQLMEGRCLALQGKVKEAEPYLASARRRLVSRWSEAHPFVRWADDMAAKLTQADDAASSD